MPRFQAAPPRTHCPDCQRPWPAAEQYRERKDGRRRLPRCQACENARLASFQARKRAKAAAARAEKAAQQAAAPPPPPKPRPGRREWAQQAVAEGKIGGYQGKKPPEAPSDRFTDALRAEVAKYQTPIVEQMVALAVQGDIQMLKFIADRMTRDDDTRSSPLKDLLRDLWHERHPPKLGGAAPDVGPAAGDPAAGGAPAEPAATAPDPGAPAEWPGGPDGAAEWGGAGGEIPHHGGRSAHLYPLDTA